MELKEFINQFAEQFEETDPSEINETTVFHELEDWSSLAGMSIIAMIRTEYDIRLTGADLRKCVTVLDVYNLVLSKK